MCTACAAPTSRHHLQLDQVIGELVDVEIVGVFDGPFLQCRPERAHFHQSNICSITT